MKLPLQVIFRDMAPLPSLEGQIRERAERLERHFAHIVSCHVAVEATGNRHHQGHRYVVNVDVRVPGGEICAGRNQGDEDIAVAVRDAFDAVTRQLQDELERRRGQVKQHPTAAPRDPADVAPADEAQTPGCGTAHAQRPPQGAA